MRSPNRIRMTSSFKLLIATAILGTVWLILLPWLADQPHVARHIRLQQQLGIDPSAMFYSELEIVPAIAHHVERLQLYTNHQQDYRPDVATDGPEESIKEQ